MVSTGDIISTNLTITYDPTQLTVNHMKVIFVDFNLASFKALPYDINGQQWRLYGTSGIYTDPYLTLSYISMYPKNYFFGITSLYDGQFLFGTLSFNATTSITNHIYYFSSEILIVAYHCPSKFPITDPAR